MRHIRDLKIYFYKKRKLLHPRPLLFIHASAHAQARIDHRASSAIFVAALASNFCCRKYTFFFLVQKE